MQGDRAVSHGPETRLEGPFEESSDVRNGALGAAVRLGGRWAICAVYVARGKRRQAFRRILAPISRAGEIAVGSSRWRLRLDITIERRGGFECGLQGEKIIACLEKLLIARRRSRGRDGELFVSSCSDLLTSKEIVEKVQSRVESRKANGTLNRTRRAEKLEIGAPWRLIFRTARREGTPCQQFGLTRSSLLGVLVGAGEARLRAGGQAGAGVQWGQKVAQDSSN